MNKIQLPLGELDHPTFLYILANACTALKWEYHAENELSAHIFCKKSAHNPNGEISIKLNQTDVEIEIKSKTGFFGSVTMEERGDHKIHQRLIQAYEFEKSKYSSIELKGLKARSDEDKKLKTEDLQKRLKENKLTPLEKIQMGVGGYHITYGLIVINILIYLLMAIKTGSFLEFNSEILDKWGGSYKMAITGGQYYRLITNIFLHGGLIHLLMNMYALYQIGIYLEPILGKSRFLTIYFAVGLLASINSICWHERVVSVGASGAIFGMYGVFVALLSTNLIERHFRKNMLQSMGAFVLYNLFYGLEGNIDNAAHIGGLVSGLLAGCLIYYFFTQKPEKNPLISNTLVGILSLVIAVSTLSFFEKNDDLYFMDHIFNQMSDLEDQAILPFKDFEDIDKKSSEDQKIAFIKIIDALKKDSIPAWSKSQEILQTGEKYKLSSRIKNLSDTYKEYIDLNIKLDQYVIKNLESGSYNLLYKDNQETRELDTALELNRDKLNKFFSEK